MMNAVEDLDLEDDIDSEVAWLSEPELNSDSEISGDEPKADDLEEDQVAKLEDTKYPDFPEESVTSDISSKSANLDDKLVPNQEEENEVINLEDDKKISFIDKIVTVDHSDNQVPNFEDNQVTALHTFSEEASYSISSMQDTQSNSLDTKESNSTDEPASQKGDAAGEVSKVDSECIQQEEKLTKEMNNLSVSSEEVSGVSTQSTPKLASDLFSNDNSEDFFSMSGKISANPKESDFQVKHAVPSDISKVNPALSSLISTTVSSLFSADDNIDDFLKPPTASTSFISPHSTLDQDRNYQAPLNGITSNVISNKEMHVNNDSSYSNKTFDNAVYSNHSINQSRPRYYTPQMDAGLKQNLSATTLVSSSLAQPTASPYESALRGSELSSPNGNSREPNMSTNNFSYSYNHPATQSTGHPITNQQVNQLNGNVAYNNLNDVKSVDKHIVHAAPNNPNYAISRSNDGNNSLTDAPKNSPSLFIPSMYSSPNNTQSYFVPDKVIDEKQMQPMNYVPSQLNMMNNNPSQPNVMNDNPSQPNMMNNVPLPPYPGNAEPKKDNVEMTQISLETENQRQRGILEWIREAVMKDWSSGAHNFKKHIKSATDSVLTTLDPGMKEYLKPGVNIGVASQRLSLLVGIKDGFTKGLSSITHIQEQPLAVPNSPLLPLGFERALKFSTTALDYLAAVHFEFGSQYVLVSPQIFLTELVSGRWSAMFCIGLKDPYRNILLHTFSQPIPLPMDCLTMLSNRMTYDSTGECTGYDVTIEEAVRQYVQCEKDADWCLVLTGIPEHHIISIAAQCLAVDYQRHLSTMNHSTQQANFTANYNSNQMYNSPSSHTDKLNYTNEKNFCTESSYPPLNTNHPSNVPQGKNYYSLPMDAFG